MKLPPPAVATVPGPITVVLAEPALAAAVVILSGLAAAARAAAVAALIL